MALLDAADANSLHAGELQSAARSTAALAQDFQSSLDAANAKIPTTFYTDAKLTLAAHAEESRRAYAEKHGAPARQTDGSELTARLPHSRERVLAAIGLAQGS